MLAVVSDFMFASAEPITVFVWGVVLVLLSLRLRTARHAPVRQQVGSAADQAPASPVRHEFLKHQVG